jgi:GST-like protein
MIKFYFHDTPNPRKVALCLEESGLQYEIAPVDLLKGEQHRSEYRAINPNGKVPAIVDDGVVLFDSAAILIYLADKTKRFFGAEPKDRPVVLSWLMFISTGLGPFSGQSYHFGRVHTDSAYAANRYRREVERHYEVLDARLEGRPYIAGGDYTIADIAAWGWVGRAATAFLNDAPLDHYANVKRWFAAVDARPAAARARDVGHDIPFKTEFDEETAKALFPQNFPKAG